MNVVEALVAGRAKFEWAPIISKFGDAELTLYVCRDALKFDGIREMATAVELQVIADLLGGMLMTPRVVDLCWLQAGVRFNAIVNVKDPDGVRRIVANSTCATVSRAVDAQLAKVGDNGGLIDSVGKYWVLVNKLKGAAGVGEACNYGWAGTDASGPGVTPGVKVWQRPGFKHDAAHEDPSQVIRVMHQQAFLRRGGNTTVVSLLDVAQDAGLAPLISHEGRLTVLRQPGVPVPPRPRDVVLSHYAPPNALIS